MGLLLLPFHFLAKKWPRSFSSVTALTEEDQDRATIPSTAAHSISGEALRSQPIQNSRSPRVTQPAKARLRRRQEDTRPHGAAGCMVISGSMASVCAELDRLIQLETNNSSPSIH